MPHDELEQAQHRFSAFAAEVLKPAMYAEEVDLAVAVHQTRDPISFAAARQAAHDAVERGWAWGPAWSTAWFHLTGRVPEGWSGRDVVLRFSCGTEALLWRDGVPVQGFDANRDRHPLFEPCRGGEAVDLRIEAACNRPLGTTVFWWDPPGTEARWTSPTPGRLDRCSLALFEAPVWRLWRAYEFARRLLAELPRESDRAHRLADGLRRATRLVDDRDVAGTAPAADEAVRSALDAPAPQGTPTCLAVGHAHIDTAWLWPIRESRRKCLRTFASALRLMEAWPAFRFLGSQPQQYAWVEVDAPALFREITARVEEGRWEATGAMWIEPDCNVPSGESLIRQIIHGVRYFRERFGDAAPQRILYLPDTFGFPASLPAIMTAAGLDTFITNKLSWNQTNAFPHASFRWRGLDGSEVLGHCTPGHDYNATLSPAELRRGARNAALLDGAGPDAWLQPFGYGDGGGGPTAGMIHDAGLAARADGVPPVALATAALFRDRLQAARLALRDDGRDLPVWDGELYLELHRGTYTTQAWLKRANRRAEEALRRVEWLASTGPGDAAPDTADVLSRLDEAWKLVLLNQFHDILPGSSIAAVYDDARAQLDAVAATCRALEADATARWADAADTTGLAGPLLVLNPGSTARAGVLDVDGRPVRVDAVPALGAAVVDGASPAASTPACGGVIVEERGLRNDLLSVRLDDAGRIASLSRVRDGREAGARTTRDDRPAPLNQLVLYEDRPRAWEAWDIDAEHVEKAFPVTGPAESIRVIERDPLRGAIEVTQALGAGSRLVQRYVLRAGSPRLDVQTRVEWHESRRLLRALFPVDVLARRATYEIQFGHVERATHRNTTREQAMFEVCGHRWMDLSEPGFGVALLNDGKYGHSCDGHVMGLSLLRSPRFPDPGADRGSHLFTYALVLHDGDWRRAGVDRLAADLNDPMRAHALPAERRGRWRGAWAPFEIEVDGAAGIVVSAWTWSADGADRIVRLVETHGGGGTVVIRWTHVARSVDEVDVHDQPRSNGPRGLAHDRGTGTTRLAVRPFEIVTLRLSS